MRRGGARGWLTRCSPPASGQSSGSPGVVGESRETPARGNPPRVGGCRCLGAPGTGGRGGPAAALMRETLCSSPKRRARSRRGARRGGTEQSRRPQGECSAVRVCGVTVSAVRTPQTRPLRLRPPPAVAVPGFPAGRAGLSKPPPPPAACRKQIGETKMGGNGPDPQRGVGNPPQDPPPPPVQTGSSSGEMAELGLGWGSPPHQDAPTAP